MESEKNKKVVIAYIKWLQILNSWQLYIFITFWKQKWKYNILEIAKRTVHIIL